MTKISDLLGPQNEDEKAIYAEQDLLFSIQFAIQRAMVDGSISQKDLADRLGKSRASVSQFFSATANPTVRSIAAVTYALGISPQMVCHSKLPVAWDQPSSNKSREATVTKMSEWVSTRTGKPVQEWSEQTKAHSRDMRRHALG